jgi:hypothetical protein
MYGTHGANNRAGQLGEKGKRSPAAINVNIKLNLI